MNKPVNVFKHFTSQLFLAYDGHVYFEEHGKPNKDLGRLFEALPKNLARINLSLSSKRSDPHLLFILTSIQEVVGKEATAVTKIINNKVNALSHFLVFYCDKDERLLPSNYLRGVEKDLSQLNQLPKIKPICKRLRVLAQLMESGPVTKIFVTEEVHQIMKGLVHLITP
jgi:hypothetical protein